MASIRRIGVLTPFAGGIGAVQRDDLFLRNCQHDFGNQAVAAACQLRIVDMRHHGNITVVSLATAIDGNGIEPGNTDHG